MTPNEFLLFLSALLFSAYSLYLNLKTSPGMTKLMSYICIYLGLGAALAVFILAIR